MCGSLLASALTHVPDGADALTPDAATEDAATSLASLRLPAGGRRVTRRAVERLTRGRAPAASGVPAVIPPFAAHRVGWWTAPWGAAALWRWLRGHPPDGSSVAHTTRSR